MVREYGTPNHKVQVTNTSRQHAMEISVDGFTGIAVESRKIVNPPMMSGPPLHLPPPSV